jgi:hypothetical protein
MSEIDLETRLRLVGSGGDGEAGDREGWWAERHADERPVAVAGGAEALVLARKRCRRDALAGTEEQLGGDCGGC